ncbi:hypothetical protein BH23CHL2_BH23CHL2_36300 [soil metagenome]
MQQTEIERNKELARRYYSELWDHGKLELAEELVALNHVDHNPPIPGRGGGREDVIHHIKVFREGFPDLRISIDELVAEGDRVVERVTMRGTHLGPFLGIAPTGKYVEVTGVNVCRIEDGKVAERWGMTDSMGMLQQLGLFPEADGPAWQGMIQMSNAYIYGSRLLEKARPALPVVGLAILALLFKRRRS